MFNFYLRVLFGKCVYSSPLTPTEAHELAFVKCISEDSVEIDYAIAPIAALTTICEWNTYLNNKNGEDKKIVITSMCRPKEETSQHKYCNAIDFHREYDGDECDVWTQYVHDARELALWLGFYWDLDVGLGIYDNLTHHVDFRRKTF